MPERTLPHRISHENKKAGYHWLQSFLERNEDISVRQAEGLSVARAQGKVLAEKGAKDVHVLTPKEKGETITLVAYFLSPVLIIKGVDKKGEFSDWLPHGSQVYMSKKSELFLKLFEEHFLPRKTPNGETILILDGHCSHSNSIELLDLAHDNGVIIICSPSHTTQPLQPLDGSFFKPLKSQQGSQCLDI
ncbi:hypothetical protein JTB14_032866 [Gonioctena quinquepunctata]|nr:hypothetical protein JTB14_032866 [Gonioctena quinquepunctata]